MHTMLQFFKSRVYSKIGSAFKNTEADFLKFKKIVGPIPIGMIKPSIGRYDHSKGYVYDIKKQRWNFRWQEESENKRDGVLSQIAAGIHTSQTGKLDHSKAGFASGQSPNRVSLIQIACPHCKKKGQMLALKRWHFTNCSKRKSQ